MGAAARFEDGSEYEGTNVENASYGASVCAERVAIWTGVAQGKRRLVALALASGAAGPIWPCGLCLQVIAEFGPNAVIITEGALGKTESASLEDLLRRPFTLPPAALSSPGDNKRHPQRKQRSAGQPRRP